jgi:hypothetical protein
MLRFFYDVVHQINLAAMDLRRIRARARIQGLAAARRKSLQAEAGRLAGRIYAQGVDAQLDRCTRG